MNACMRGIVLFCFLLPCLRLSALGVVKVSTTYEKKNELHGYGVLAKAPGGVWLVLTVSHLSQGNDGGIDNPVRIHYQEDGSSEWKEAKVLSRVASNRRDSEVIRIEPLEGIQPLLIYNGGGFELSAAAEAFLSSAGKACFDYRGTDGFFLHCGAEVKRPPTVLDTRHDLTRMFSRTGFVVADYEMMVLGDIRPGMSGLPFFVRSDKRFKFIGLASTYSRQFRSGWLMPEYFFSELLRKYERELHLQSSKEGFIKGFHYWRFERGFTSRRGAFTFDPVTQETSKYRRTIFYEEAGSVEVSSQASRAGSGGGSRADGGGGSRADGGGGSRADGGGGSRADGGGGDVSALSSGGLKLGATKDTMRPVTAFYVRTIDEMNQEFILPPDFASLNVSAEMLYLWLEGIGPEVKMLIGFKDKEEDFLAGVVWERLSRLAQSTDPDHFMINATVMALPLSVSPPKTDAVLTLVRRKGEAGEYSIAIEFEGETYKASLSAERFLAGLTFELPPTRAGGPSLTLDAKGLLFDSPSSMRILNLDVHRDLLADIKSYKDQPFLKRGFFLKIHDKQFFAFFH